MPEKYIFTLKALRINKGLSQEEAAKKLGISTRTLQFYENGERYPDVPMVKKMENLYDIEYKNIDFF